MTRTPAVVLLLALASSLMPGCIIGEIRDEMRASNAQLQNVNERLDLVDRSLAKLQTTNELLQGVQTDLGKLDRTNNSLNSANTQLKLLDSLDTSLKDLDKHLASLRRTIGRIDSAIPFLDLGADAVEPPATPSAPGVEPAPAEPGAPAPATPPAREFFAGTWLLRFPTQTESLVLLADGTYLRAGPPPLPLERGAWKRAGQTITLKENDSPGTDAAGKPINVPGRERSWLILNQSVRSFAAQDQSGVVMVYARP